MGFRMAAPWLVTASAVLAGAILLALTWTEWREVKHGCPREGVEGCFGPKGSYTTVFGHETRPGPAEGSLALGAVAAVALGTLHLWRRWRWPWAVAWLAWIGVAVVAGYLAHMRWVATNPDY